MDDYGKELIIDLHYCNPFLLNRKFIRNYFKEVCVLINMERCDLHWWDDLHTPEEEKQTEPHLIGTTAVQFIKTSNITVHALDILQKVFINVFSCKNFDDEVVVQFSEGWFDGVAVNKQVVRRI